MKKHVADSVAQVALNPASSKTTALVRYVGFEVINGQRRLNFSIKPFGIDPVDVTVTVPDAAFTGRFRISVQDALPIAYDKLVRLSGTDCGLQVNQLFLTDHDIVQYRRNQADKRLPT